MSVRVSRASLEILELQSTIMRTIDEMLGSDAASVSAHLQRNQDQTRTNFEVMPTNEEGKLDHAAVRYALHSISCGATAGLSVGSPVVGEGFQGHSGKFGASADDHANDRREAWL